MPTAANAGGRMSKLVFGEHPNSIARTLNLPGTDPALAVISAVNRKSYAQELRELEAWCKAGFVSGFSVTNMDEEGESGVV